MKNIFKKIGEFLEKVLKSFFEWLSKDFKNVLIVGLLVLLIIFFFKLRSVSSLYENKISEMRDTVCLYENKLGEVYSQNRAYLTDISNLKLANDELYKEVKSLKDNPVVVTKINTVTKIDSIYVVDTIYCYSPDKYVSNIRYSDDWCNIGGYMNFDLKNMKSECMLDSIFFINNLTVDLIDRKGYLSFIVKSDNPYCQINNVYGAVVSPEKSKALKQRFDKKWCLVAGVGPAVTIVDSQVKIYPAVQLTFGYKIFGF